MCCRLRSLAASVSRQRRDTSGFSPAFNWFYPLYARTWCYVSCLYPAQCVGQVEWTWAPHCGLAAKSGSTPTGMPQIWRQHCIVRVIAFCCTHAVMATIMKTGHLERSRFLCAADSSLAASVSRQRRDTRGFSPAFNWFYPLYARMWCYVSCLYSAQRVGQVEEAEGEG